ncbi:hypothetical protein RvY_16774-2 [Ramazzottius varieornatus]|nr:hypothetical protein RvY_16774-2 [Ramazzottius varieornatus]
MFPMASSISLLLCVSGVLSLQKIHVVQTQSTPWIEGGNTAPNFQLTPQQFDAAQPTAVSQATPVNNQESNVVDANPTEPRMEDGGKMFLGVLSSYLEYETFKNNKEDDNRPLSVFYEGLGWFYRNGSLSNIDRLPASPAEVDTKFLLYTAPNQMTGQLLNYANVSSIHLSNFQPGWPTVVITHGFKTSTGTASLQWVMLYIDALFRRQGPGNYIVTDWSKGAQAPEYWAAAANAPLVGAQLARLIELLCEVKGAQPQSIQLIGFSLGAHVSGFAGKRLKLTSGKIARIVGLDPAGPLFEDAPAGGRLSKGDADFVMTVHGSADGVKNGGLGIWSQIGDVDFYANGGK